MNKAVHESPCGQDHIIGLDAFTRGGPYAFTLSSGNDKSRNFILGYLKSIL